MPHFSITSQSPHIIRRLRRNSPSTVGAIFSSATAAGS